LLVSETVIVAALLKETRLGAGDVRVKIRSGLPMHAISRLFGRDEVKTLSWVRRKHHKALDSLLEATTFCKAYLHFCVLGSLMDVVGSTYLHMHLCKYGQES
jgi:hypothetical protein